MMLIWLLCYALPALCSFFISKRFKIPKHRILVIHGGIITSIILLSFLGLPLHFKFNLTEEGFFLISALFSLSVLGYVGLGYWVSAIIQEYCLLLAGVLGMEAFGLPGGIFLTASVFALAHLLNPIHWPQKVPLTFFWGCSSLLLYIWLRDPLLNAALHTVLGALLIRRKILFSNLSRLNEIDPV